MGHRPARFSFLVFLPVDGNPLKSERSSTRLPKTLSHGGLEGHGGPYDPGIGNLCDLSWVSNAGS